MGFRSENVPSLRLESRRLSFYGILLSDAAQHLKEQGQIFVKETRISVNPRSNIFKYEIEKRTADNTAIPKRCKDCGHIQFTFRDPNTGVLNTTLASWAVGNTTTFVIKYYDNSRDSIIIIGSPFSPYIVYGDKK